MKNEKYKGYLAGYKNPNIEDKLDEDELEELRERKRRFFNEDSKMLRENLNTRCR